MTRAASPCISLCKVDPASGVCIGCFRTLDEIAGWAEGGAERQFEIRELALARLGGESTVKACGHCRTWFSCAQASGHCWCTQMTGQPQGSGCLCPLCLRARSGAARPDAGA